MRFKQLSLNSKGFTFIELLVVMAIIAILSGLGLLVSLDIYRSYSFNSERDVVLAFLQKARSQSLANINQQSHGVHFAGDSYVLFAGNTYNSSDDNNQVYLKDPGINNTGMVDVIFEQLSGNLISGAGTLTLTDGKRRSAINLNLVGQINW